MIHRTSQQSIPTAGLIGNAFVAATTLVALMWNSGSVATADKADRAGYAVAGGRTVYGPIVHENLALFVITGKETLPQDADYVTLSEAMKNEWVVVHETGSVNTLAVENITEDRTIVILAGAVVKGGKQDRVLSHDMVLKPKSGKVPISSFCVEQSRWSQRGSEQLDRFASNSAQVSGKELRKAVKGGSGQSKVWEEVAKEQAKISNNIQVDARSPESPTSFQLAIENKELQKLSAAYKAALASTIDQYPEAIGYAVVINGEFSTADVYGSRKLLRKTWDQHLASAVTEAISIKDKAKQDTHVDLKWRDAIFKEKSFEKVIDTKIAGGNRYVAGQNSAFFRYKSDLPSESANAAPFTVRSSYEKRSAGESLQQKSGTQAMQQTNRSE